MEARGVVDMKVAVVMLGIISGPSRPRVQLWRGAGRHCAKMFAHRR